MISHGGCRVSLTGDTPQPPALNPVPLLLLFHLPHGSSGAVDDAALPAVCHC